jgi:hypothetical protein
LGAFCPPGEVLVVLLAAVPGDEGMGATLSDKRERGMARFTST